MFKKATKYGAAPKETHKPAENASSSSQQADDCRNPDRPELPPPGPSNIIVLTPNFLPAPKNVESQ